MLYKLCEAYFSENVLYRKYRYILLGPVLSGHYQLGKTLSRLNRSTLVDCCMCRKNIWLVVFKVSLLGFIKCYIHSICLHSNLQKKKNPQHEPFSN